MTAPEIIIPKHGPKLVILPVKDVQTVATMVTVRTGSRNEQAEYAGISHVLEHMMFKGTKKYPKAEHISKMLDALGAQYNAMTGKHETSYFIKTEVAHFETQMSMLSDMILHPQLRATDWARERGVILEELKMYDENPVMKIDSLLDEAQFGNTSLGIDIGGNQKTVSHISTADIKAYWKDRYTKGDVTVIVAGNVSAAQAKRLVKKYFPTQQHMILSNDPLPAVTALSEIQAKELPNEQVQFAISWPGVSVTDQRLHACNLLALAMGGMMSSRLFTSVRERRGLAYSVSMSHDVHPDIGRFSVSAGLDASRLAEAVSVIASEIASVARKGLRSEELRVAKTHLRGQRAIRFEDPLARATWYARDVVWNRPVRSLQADIKKYDSVTDAQIKSVARELLSGAPALAIIGNKEVISRAEEWRSTLAV